jgi:transketolase
MNRNTTTYEEKIIEITSGHPEVLVMTAENRAAIRSLPEALGDRFIDVGIAEQTLIGVAAGLALRGRIPIAHGIAAFLILRAFEFIRSDVGIASLPVKLVGWQPGLLSEANGPTHQAIEDVALMRTIPGMEIFCPADRAELVDGLPAVISRPGPCYVRYNSSEPAITHSAAQQYGRAELVFEGSDVSILVYGFLLREAVKAALILQREGVSVRLLNMRTLSPLDEKAILDSARRTQLMVTVEDHLLIGGLYAAVAETLVKNRAICQVLPIGLTGRWFRPALLEDVIEHEGFSGEQIASKILRSLRQLSIPASSLPVH